MKLTKDQKMYVQSLDTDDEFCHIVLRSMQRDGKQSEYAYNLFYDHYDESILKKFGPVYSYDGGNQALWGMRLFFKDNENPEEKILEIIKAHTDEINRIKNKINKGEAS